MLETNFGKLRNGNFTLSKLDDMEEIGKQLISHNVQPEVVDFIKHTSLPKGHPKYMSQAEAAKEFLPTLSLYQAQLKAMQAYREFWKQLFFGSELKHYQQLYETRNKKPDGRKRKKDIPIEERAEKETRIQLNRAFRSQEGLRDKGRMSKMNNEKFERYLKNHTKLAYNKILQEIKATETDNLVPA
jgi:hypothetical protein